MAAFAATFNPESIRLIFKLTHYHAPDFRLVAWLPCAPERASLTFSRNPKQHDGPGAHRYRGRCMWGTQNTSATPRNLYLRHGLLKHHDLGGLMATDEKSYLNDNQLLFHVQHLMLLAGDSR